MDTKDPNLNQRIAALLDKLPKGNSSLALRCRSHPRFHQFIVEATKALINFYGQMDKDDAVQIFESKLRRWTIKTPDAYLGFAGELFVADWLRRKGVPHLFIRETRTRKTPDIELTAGGRVVYLEVKTLEESYYDWFAQRVLDEIESFLPNRGIRIEELDMGEGMEEALVARAVHKIQDWLKAPYAPIQYEGKEGKFSIVLPPGRGLMYRPESVNMKRVREDGTPWAQSKLEDTLTDSIEKFKASKPTFLVWVNPQDLALSESINEHVARALERCGQDFACVAGVIVLDPVFGWNLTENQSYQEYRQLKDSGLIQAIGALRGRT
jgi:hypothetical protein